MKIELRSLLMAALLGSLLMNTPATGQKKARPDWQRLLEQRLPVYGHRNWIVIADSAYPSQSRAGIETIATGGDQLEIVQAVLARIERAPHIRPTIYLDAELPYVDEKYAKGIATYRQGLKRLLGDRPAQSLPHDQIIAKLDQTGATFNVLILKTTLALPYTSVFLELDCGYWSSEAEAMLRAAMKKER